MVVRAARRTRRFRTEDDVKQGRIIHYNRDGGHGIVSVDCRQYPFEIGHWRADYAPELNMEVGLLLDEAGAVEDVVPCCAVFPRLAQPDAACTCPPQPWLVLVRRRAACAVRSVLGSIGWMPLAGFALFAVAMLLGDAASAAVLGSRVGGSLYAMLAHGGLSALVWLSALALVLPCLWRDRLAWLGFLLPLASVVLALFSLFNEYGALAESLRGLSDAVGASVPAVAPARAFLGQLTLGLPFYLALAASVALALFGASRFRGHPPARHPAA